MGVAPHSKITFGSGQHGIPEIAWMAAKIAKSSLAEILQEYVESGLLSVDQAQETAEMLLSGNAKRLYKF